MLPWKPHFWSKNFTIFCFDISNDYLFISEYNALYILRTFMVVHQAREISIGKTNEKTECQITREDCKSDQSHNQCPRCPRSRSWGRQQEHQLPRTSVLHSSRSARKVRKTVQMFQRKRKTQKIQKIRRTSLLQSSWIVVNCFYFVSSSPNHHQSFRQCAQWQPHCNLSQSVPPWWRALA